MPHLSGVFDEFPDLDKISIEELAKGLSFKLEVHALINYLGNRIIYPQSVPLTRKELELDLAILRAGCKVRPGLFYEPQSNRIVIPQKFIERFPDVELLLKSIVEGINPKGVHFVFAKTGSKFNLVGSVISPLNPQKLSIDGKSVQFTGLAITKALPLNDISVIQTPAKTARVRLGNEEFEIGGGSVGIMIDLRLGGFA